MFRTTLSVALAVSALALAQTQVNIGPGGAVEVKNAKGGKVKVGSGGKVETITDKGTTSVSEDGKTVTAEGAAGSTTVKDGRTVEITTTGRPAAKGGATTAVGTATANGEFSVADNEQVIEHTCVDGERVNVLGNENTLTLHGPCAAVSVAGNQNKVVVDVVGAIDAMGNKNTVSWRAALKGKSPKVASLGTANSISQLR